jgi:serine/threonine-protein kinase
VPDGVVGVTVEAAEEALNEAGLTPRKEQQHDSDVPEGEVISAVPDEGQRWHRDEPVRLVVSLGQEQAEVPEGLVGMDERAARAALEGVGLTDIEVSREYTDDGPRDEVIWASVRDGDMVPTDERVRLTVSDGPPPVTVPDVAGLEVDDATATLSAEKFKVAREDVFDEEAPAGTVIRTEPGGDEGAAEGGTVTIFVSLGPEGTVPDVVGMSVEDAQDTLEKAGYEVELRAFSSVSWRPTPSRVNS